MASIHRIGFADIYRQICNSDLPLSTLACRLDREADAELAMGHIGAAERLATQAAELRGLSA